jgi:predicted nucleic acid-binding protein
MIVLDTNVLSEVMSSSPDPPVRHWLARQSSSQLFTTSISMAEIFQGIELLPQGKRRDGLSGAAQTLFAGLFSGRVLPFDEHAARAFAPIAVNRRVRGRPISLFDAQIAAIAQAHGATLSTRDIADFEGCGVRLVNPWQPSDT